MNTKQSTTYLLWYGEAAIAGHEPTEEEFAMFKEAREVSKIMAHKIMRINPEDYAYVHGKSFDE